MHNMSLLHRDIKPENIFLTALGKFKLGDFGLAIRIDKELAFSRSGTLDYMAPEVSQTALQCSRDACWMSMAVKVPGNTCQALTFTLAPCGSKWQQPQC